MADAVATIRVRTRVACAPVAVLVGVLNLAGGGLDPLPWLTGGAALSALGALRYLAARQRP